MILKIDHIAFSSPNFEDDLKTFGALGYDVHFMEKGLRDLDNKRQFMKHYCGQLDMALMTRRGSISVELLNHGHVVDEDSYVLPILEGACCEVEVINDLLAFNDCSFVKARSNFLKSEFFITEGGNETEFCCNKLVVDTDNVEKGADFWRCLGFKPVAVGENVAHLEFRSPFSDGPVQLYVRRKTPRAHRFFLDSHGFNCIAFISTDTQKERRRFEELEMEPTEVNLFRVNGKDLCIFWIRGPHREIVEIIGLAK